MVKWTTRLTAAKRPSKKRIWEIWIKGTILLLIPYHMKKEKEDHTWMKMLVRVLSRFQQHWPSPHTYIRLDTYRIPEHLMGILEADQFERLSPSRKGEYIFLFPDCQDQRVWEAVFETGTVVDCGRAIFVLNCKPANWQEIIARLFEIAQALSQGHRTDEYESELSICRCLSYSFDENLAIEKVDLPEGTVLSILEDIAREESLELIVHRR